MKRPSKVRRMRGAVLCQIESIKLFAFECLTPAQMILLSRALIDAANDIATAADLERANVRKGGRG